MRTLPTPPWLHEVIMGNVPNYKAYQLVFHSNYVDTTERTIIDLANTDTTLPTVAESVKVSSTSANDTAVGTGARTVRIEYLDANYITAYETVTLNGQTAVQTTANMFRIQSIIVMTAGSNKTNVGTIYVGTGTVTSGVPATIYNACVAGEGQSMVGIYTLEAGWTAINYAFIGSVTSTQYLKARFSSQDSSGIIRVGQEFPMSGSSIATDQVISVLIPEKSDLRCRAVTVSGGTGAIGGRVMLVLARLGEANRVT